MANSAQVRAETPLTGGKVLLMLVAFFAVVFAVNGLMMFDAISTFRGEVVDHPYELGLAYNSQIAAADAQNERHWKVDVDLTSGAPSATFRDAEGKPVEGLTVTGVFAAPMDRKRDQSFAMSEVSPGLYAAHVPPLAGIRELDLTAVRDGQTLFRSHNRVTLR